MLEKLAYKETRKAERLEKKTAPQLNILDCPQKAIPTPNLEEILGCVVQEKASAMNYAKYATDPRTEVQQQKDYLFQSLEQEIARKEIALRSIFNIDCSPIETVGELRQALKEGWLQPADLVNDYPDSFPFSLDNAYSLGSWVKLVNPNRVVDPEGFENAKKEVRKAASEVKDQIVVFGAEKGLEALNAFKAQKFA